MSSNEHFSISLFVEQNVVLIGIDICCRYGSHTPRVNGPCAMANHSVKPFNITSMVFHVRSINSTVVHH